MNVKKEELGVLEAHLQPLNVSAPTPPSSQISNSTQHISFETTPSPKANGTWRGAYGPLLTPEIPLIHESLPETLTVRVRLYDNRDDVPKKGLRRIKRVAAEAALLVFH
ncbi:hypothetical protein FRC12_023324 [Ceratobasidium sp. 428]|nr:hypothetical protein FRC12_023324 [Ceratobasidium sp. 428]